MRRSVVGHRLALAASAPLLVVGLAGCGSGDDEPTARPSASASSPAAPSGATPVPDASSAPTGRAVAPAAFRRTVERSIDRSTTAQIALDVGTGTMTLSGTGQVDYTGATPAMALKITVPSLGRGKADVRIVDRDLYVSLPMLGSGDTFYRADLDDPDGGLGQLGAVSAFDPQSTLQQLSRSLKTVTYDGQDRVDGDLCDHYTVTADTTDLATASPSTDSTGSGQIPSTVTFDVWLDGSDLLRKVDTSLGSRATVTVTLTDWGSPVDIAKPPASQVKEMPAS